MKNKVIGILITPTRAASCLYLGVSSVNGGEKNYWVPIDIVLKKMCEIGLVKSGYVKPCWIESILS
uniref:Uncharacterized protein n=1 Tax=Strigamia maritima TaxID=126957 RepID=T1IUD1_STRMM